MKKKFSLEALKVDARTHVKKFNRCQRLKKGDNKYGNIPHMEANDVTC